MEDKIKIPTILKWVGGKRRIIDKIERYFPKKIETYYEPFLGGASVFFYIKQKYNPKNCILSDLNKDLINVYLAVKNKPKLLIYYLKKYRKLNNEKNYYEIRNKFNLNKIRGVHRAAVFIYLNKTCFQGIYRVNLKNEFNVPFGKYENPQIFNEETIFFASELLQNVKIICQDYQEIIKDVKKKDFLYLDPCYDPITKTSFTQYNNKSFNKEQRIQLNTFMKYCKAKGANFVLSYSNTDEVLKLYKKDFFVNIIKCPRLINSAHSKRHYIDELIVTNVIKKKIVI